MSSSSRQQGSATNTVKDLCKGLRTNPGKLFLLDGGTGEELFQRGVPDDRKIWSAVALVKKEYQTPLAEVHRSFLQAGADAITTNSYGVVPGVGFNEEEIEKHVTTAGRIAHQVVSGIETRNRKFVMGSLGPLLESYRPDKILKDEEGMKVYSVIARSLAPFVDVFIVETMSCVEESSQAIRAVGLLGLHDKPMMVSYTLDSNGRLRNDESAISAVTRTIDLCSQNKVDLLGVLFNCAEPESISIALKSVHKNAKLQQTLRDRGVVTGAYANRLTPVDPGWSLEDSEGAQATRTDLGISKYSNEFVSTWVKEYGAQVIGGCCGIGPEYIEYIDKNLRRSGSGEL